MCVCSLQEVWLLRCRVSSRTVSSRAVCGVRVGVYDVEEKEKGREKEGASRLMVEIWKEKKKYEGDAFIIFMTLHAM